MLSLSPGAPGPAPAVKSNATPAAQAVSPNLSSLMSMGYSLEQAQRALRDSQDDVETAKTLLMFEPKLGAKKS